MVHRPGPRLRGPSTTNIPEGGGEWVLVQVNNRFDSYPLEYRRLAASVIGGRDPIPEKIWTIELPTS